MDSATAEDRCLRVRKKTLRVMQTVLYQSSPLHAFHHHEEDLLRLAAVVVEGFLDGDQKLVSDTLTQQPVEVSTLSHGAEQVNTPLLQ